MYQKILWQENTKLIIGFLSILSFSKTFTAEFYLSKFDIPTLSKLTGNICFRPRNAGVSLALKQIFLCTIKSKLYHLCLPSESREHHFLSFCPFALHIGARLVKNIFYSLDLLTVQYRCSWQLMNTRKYGYTETVNDSEPRWLEQQCRRRKRKSIWLALTISSLRWWKNAQCPGMKSKTGIDVYHQQTQQLKIRHRWIS